MKKVPFFCDQCGSKLINGKCSENCCQEDYVYSSKANISNTDKTSYFDMLFDMCERHLNGVILNEQPGLPSCRGGCSCEHYIFEAAMKLCLGEEVFKHLNKFS
jgi:hypothetical protein